MKDSEITIDDLAKKIDALASSVDVSSKGIGYLAKNLDDLAAITKKGIEDERATVLRLNLHLQLNQAEGVATEVAKLEHGQSMRSRLALARYYCFRGDPVNAEIYARMAVEHSRNGSVGARRNS